MPKLIRRLRYLFDVSSGRLRSRAGSPYGVTVERARAELDAISRQFRADRGLTPVDVQLIEPTFFPNPLKRRNADWIFKMISSHGPALRLDTNGQVSGRDLC